MLQRLSRLSTQTMLAIVTLAFIAGLAGLIVQIRTVERHVETLRSLGLAEMTRSVYTAHIHFMEARQTLRLRALGQDSEWRAKFAVLAGDAAAIRAFAARSNVTAVEADAARRYGALMLAAQSVFDTQPDETRATKAVDRMMGAAEPMFGTLGRGALRQSQAARAAFERGNAHLFAQVHVMACGAMIMLMALMLIVLRMLHALRARNASLVALSGDLRHALDARQRLLAGISHDLRTPLHAISGFAQIMLHKDIRTDEDKRQRFLGQILDAARKLERMTADLLDLARMERMERMEQGGAALTLHPGVGLLDLARGVVARMGPVAGQRQVALVGPAESAPESVGAAALRSHADRGAVIRALTALVEAGVKESAPGGVVTVSVEAQAGEIALGVTHLSAASAQDPAATAAVGDAGGRAGGRSGGRAGGADRAWPEGSDADISGSAMLVAIARALALAHGGRLTARDLPGGARKVAIHLPTAQGRARADQAEPGADQAAPNADPAGPHADQAAPGAGPSPAAGASGRHLIEQPIEGI
jgi:signal transduction histidine kinase